MAHLLGAEALHLEYPTRVIFDKVTIGLDEGDRIGIVGRNGDGKSTLLRMLAGRLEPDSGRVTIKMEYGPNDNEISRIYEGRVKPEQVRFDPVEISEIRYMSMEEIKAGISNEKGIFCGWFVEIMNWYFHQPTKLTVLKGE